MRSNNEKVREFSQELEAGFSGVARIASATAPLSNWLQGSVVVRRIFQPLIGIHPRRRMPVFVRKTFSRWLRKHPPQSRPHAASKVVLFNDTFTNYNEPVIGISALRLLEDMGAQVLIPEVVRCGRPMISEGLSVETRQDAKRFNIQR